MSRSIVVLLTIGLFSKFSYGDLPPEISKCRTGDTSCIAKRINEVLRKYPKGSSDLGLPPLDKLSFTNVQISQPKGDGPFQLAFKLTSADLYGIEKTRVDRVVGFEDDLDHSPFEVYGLLPNFDIKGNYDTHGKVLLLPMNGNGPLEINLKNVKFSMKVKTTTQMKNGKRYGNVKKLKMQLEPELMHVRLENLFNGNKELSDSMNQLINENWKDIWNELSPGIIAFVEKLLSDLLKGVLKELSFDDMYKKD